MTEIKIIECGQKKGPTLKKKFICCSEFILRTAFCYHLKLWHGVDYFLSISDSGVILSERVVQDTYCQKQPGARVEGQWHAILHKSLMSRLMIQIKHKDLSTGDAMTSKLKTYWNSLIIALVWVLSTFIFHLNQLNICHQGEY